MKKSADILHNVTNTPPTVNDDSSKGYSVGSRWVDQSSDKLWVCYDTNAGAAVWKDSTDRANHTGTQPATTVTYDNSTSSYVSTNVQDVIDEIDAILSDLYLVKYALVNETITVPANAMYTVWGDLTIDPTSTLENYGKIAIINGALDDQGVFDNHGTLELIDVVTEGSNGITAAGRTVELGGALNKTTSILGTGDSEKLAFGYDQNTAQFQQWYQQNGINLKSFTVVTDGSAFETVNGSYNGEGTFIGAKGEFIDFSNPYENNYLHLTKNSTRFQLEGYDENLDYFQTAIDIQKGSLGLQFWNYDSIQTYGSYSFEMVYNDFNNQAVFTDSTPRGAGIEYAQDYSGGYTNRSLVDKEYVDNVTSGGITTASNGLSIVGSDVRLGGALTQYTAIEGNNHTMELGISSNSLTSFNVSSDFFLVDNGFTATTGASGSRISSSISNVSILTATSNTGSFGNLHKIDTGTTYTSMTSPHHQLNMTSGSGGTGSAIFEDRLGFGLQYFSNYHTGYTNRSLVDKEYVDLAVAGGSSLTGSGSQFQIAYFDSNTNITSDSNLTYNGNLLGLGQNFNTNFKFLCFTDQEVYSAYIQSGTSNQVGNATGLGINTYGSNNYANVGIESSVNSGLQWNVAGHFRTGGGLVEPPLNYDAAIIGQADGTTRSNIGVMGQAWAFNNATNIGGRFFASSGNFNYSVQLEDGTEGVGKVLTCMTADGKAQWQTPSGGGFTLANGSGTTANGSAVDLGGTLTSNAIVNGAGSFNVELGSNVASQNLTRFDVNATFNTQRYLGTFPSGDGLVVNRNPGTDSSTITSGTQTSSHSASASQQLFSVGDGTNLTTVTHNAGVYDAISTGTGNNSGRLYLDGASGLAYLSTGAASNKGGQLLLDATNTFTDYNTVKSGLEYAADYSANYTLRSLVDKEYVDNAVGGGGVGGSGTLNYVPRWTPNGTTLGDSTIQDNGTTASAGDWSPDAGVQMRVRANGDRIRAFQAENTGSTSSFNYGGQFSNINTATSNAVGIEGSSTGANTTNVGGSFSANGATNNYAVKLTDGTEGLNKILVSATSDGKSKWEYKGILPQVTENAPPLGGGYVVLDSDYTIFAGTTSASFSIFLPAAASSAGRVIVVKKKDAANTLSVVGNGAELIDGNNVYSMTAQYDKVTVQCDGTQWWTI